MKRVNFLRVFAAAILASSFLAAILGTLLWQRRFSPCLLLQGRSEQGLR